MHFMNTLIKSKINRLAFDVVERNITAFHHFDSVYLFGSILDGKKIPNDIDVLLIYSKYSDEIKNEIKIFSSLLEQECGLQVDYTILSIEEENETGFIKRIHPRYLKLK